MESEPYLLRAEALLKGTTEIQTFSMLDRARSDAALAAGNLEEARRFAIASYSRFEAPDSTGRVKAGRLSVWLEDPESVRRILSELEEVPGRVARIQEVELGAGLAALEGRTRDATTGYRDAAARWRELGVRFELALCDLTMVRTLGTGVAEAREAAAGARQVLSELGAKPLLSLLDAAEAAASRADESAAERAAIPRGKASTPAR